MTEAAESRYLAQPAPSFWRSLRYLSDARLVVAALLLAYVPLLGRDLALQQSFDDRLFLQLASAYFVFAMVCSLVVRAAPRAFHAQLLAQVLADILVIGAIIYAAGGARSGLGVLMITPTAGAAVLSTPLLSMFVAAAASLVLLAESLWRRLLADVEGQVGSDGGLFVAAVISATLFITVIFVNRLARRLAEQERLAFGRGEDLRNQLAINEMVIAELDQGVVVLDRKGRIKALNPRARLMLGLPRDEPVQSVDPAAASALRALVAGGRLVSELSLGANGRARINLRARLLAGEGPPDGSGAAPAGELIDKVVLLEDLDRLEERARQLKLAAMGRLSASIAHEIRNPLGAIRHAGNLLAEQVPPGSLLRMTAIIEANSLRIDRIVEDVLSTARRSPDREPVHLPQFLSTLLPELIAQAGASRERIALQIESRQAMLFDPGHLRQILVNLLGNALRYASNTPGAVLVSWQETADRRAVLRVLDDGPGIDAAVLDRLFEPFFTTEARGTGLGLHNAQELCAANGADLRYERRSGGRHGGGFVIEPEVWSGLRADADVGAVPLAGSSLPDDGSWQKKQTA